MTEHVWRDPESIPRDGSPVLVLLDGWVVYACRHGTGEDEGGNEVDRWMDIDWHGHCFDEDDGSIILGWLPFPAIQDPCPWSVEEKRRQKAPEIRLK